ncbi:hypothetical protein BRCON_2673 [Candidatus Sumerlaea chitinivorans]|uniref:Uncharacterized protein n=1 Tax=Sumerlaea chitinivorans TaxID=2250252 RepID=A0A2Z4YAK8_SUMC1|nr:hypothetical protein BRCON_2673 [Candidatus Sumerlaea chitinivorans]
MRFLRALRGFACGNFLFAHEKREDAKTRTAMWQGVAAYVFCEKAVQEGGLP